MWEGVADVNIKKSGGIVNKNADTHKKNTVNDIVTQKIMINVYVKQIKDKE